MDGKFVAGETAEELDARYEACRDLVTELTAYTLQKQAKHPDRPMGELLRRMRGAVATKGWDLDASELRWVMQRIAIGVGAAPVDVPDDDVAIPMQLTDATAHVHVESIVDLALSRRVGREATRAATDGPEDLVAKRIEED
ncbi:MAG: hypothetical protein JF628_06765 [Sphingomonas sp.]|nr:hypothetical protein [Sphingomonas sp.]MBW8844159.1 hypothetical protein [Burkholderiales bacterium]